MGYGWRLSAFGQKAGPSEDEALYPNTDMTNTIYLRLPTKQPVAEHLGKTEEAEKYRF